VIVPTSHVARCTLVQTLDDLRVVLDLQHEVLCGVLRIMRGCSASWQGAHVMRVPLASAQLTRCIMAHRPILAKMNNTHTTAMEALHTYAPH
jgi:hypothetical protein